MIVVEIEPNPNCDPVDMRVFHDLEPPRRVTHVRLERIPGQAKWYEVVGWMQQAAPCPALVQKVDDSGDGIALLIRGGDAGLRFREEGSSLDWDINEPSQRGESFYITTDADDIRSEGASDS